MGFPFLGNMQRKVGRELGCCFPILFIGGSLRIFRMIKKIIEDTDTFAGKVFDVFIQFLILVSLISFSIETLPNLSSDSRYWLYIIEVGTVSLFTIEYVLRLVVADNSLKYIFSFYGLVDLIAIAPFYISVGIDLRAVRGIETVSSFSSFQICSVYQSD